ncbi:MAG: DUF2232 domain-containing protein [Anaerosomatales bacterium]|nr:DUF2232 domain-containing protein [Anaerosomatales bacterium]
MPDLSHTRDGVLLSAAVVLGGFLAPVLPAIGFPMAAAGLAGLVYRGRVTLAALAGGMAVAFGTFMAPYDAALLVPAFVALLFAIGGMQRRTALANVTLLTAAIAAGSLASAVLYAWLQGTTFLAITLESAQSAVAVFVEAAGGAGADGMLFGVDAEVLADTMFRLWPVDYFASALLAAVLSVAVAGWAASRTGATVQRLPRLDAVDLSLHVLWPFIGAFVFLAAGRVMSDGTTATTVGLNLLLGTRLLLLAQGLGVVAAFYRRIGLGRVARGLGYVLLVLADSVMPLVSIVGLIDFWANFRKLPREDSTLPERVEDENSGD